MLIDFHTHCFPDQLANDAVSRLKGIVHSDPATNGTYGDLLAKLDDWGVDCAVILNVAVSERQQTNVNNFAATINNKKNSFGFGSIHAGNRDALQETYRIADLGLRGFKLHPDYQEIDMLDRRLFPVYDAASELGLLCVYHAGWDPVSPDKTRVTPDNILRVHRLFPHLNMVLAHLGGYSYWDEVEDRIAGTGILMDTALTKGALGAEQFTRIIQKHGAENILFGSDCPWQSSRVTAEYIDSLPISSKQKELIFFQNACRLLEIH